MEKSPNGKKARNLPSGIRDMISKSWGRETFLGSLTFAELTDLEDHARSFSCPNGTVLFGEGDLPESVFILQEGQVTLSVNSDDGKRLVIGTARPGEVLGLASVLIGSPYEMATATQYTFRALAIDRLEFLQFLRAHISALESAALSLSQSYNQACTRFRTLSGTPTCRAKIARLLLEFSQSGRQTEMGFHLPLNHQEIGDWVGMSRESVTRVLGAFRRENLIAQKGSCLSIRDRSSLERFAAERKLVRTDENRRNSIHFDATDDEPIDHLIEQVTAMLQRHKIQLPN